MINFSYLAPPDEAQKITHSDYYIKHFDKEKGIRKIFETVVYDEFEQQKIKELKEEIKKQKIILSSDWKESDYLLLAYAGRFQMKNVIKKLQQHITWRCNKIYHDINTHSEKFLKEGICYVYGRDKQYRPIIIVNAHLIDLKKYDCDVILQALSYFLGVIMKNMFIPGKIENWILIVETNNEGVFRVPPNTLEIIVENLNINFTGHLEKMFILNPSQGLNQRWKQIQSTLDQETLDKIIFLQQKEIKKLLEVIPQNQLEEKFGGTQPNQTKFWPPYNIDLPDGYTMKKKSTNNQQQQENQQKQQVLSEEEDDPYDKVDFNLNDFMKQQQQIYYSGALKPELYEQNNDQLQEQQVFEEKKEQKVEEKIDQKVEEKKDQKVEEKNDQKREYLDEPEQPDLQKPEEHKEQQQVVQEVKESTDQAVLSDRQKLKQQETEQNKLVTHDEQGFNSSANKLVDESKKEEPVQPQIDPVSNNNQACCQGCEIF